MIKSSGLRLLYGKCSTNVIRMLEANGSGLAMLSQYWDKTLLGWQTTWELLVMLVWVLISMLLKGEWIVLNLGHLTGGTTSRIEPLRLWIRLLTILPSQTRANQADQCQHCCTAVMIFNLLYRWLSEGKYFSTPKFSSSGSRTHDLWTTLKRNLSHWARASPDFLIFLFL